MLKDKDFTERIIPLFVIVMIAWVLVFLVISFYREIRIKESDDAPGGVCFNKLGPLFGSGVQVNES
jgi:hypothetical protein